MTKFLEKNKGGILLFIVCVIMLSYYSNRIAELREQEQQNQVNITEKR